MVNIDTTVWFVYALHSKDNNRIYVGMSENPAKRLKAHNKGSVKSTKAFIPWEIFFIEQVIGSVNARRLEKYYKGARGRKILWGKIFYRS